MPMVFLVLVSLLVSSTESAQFLNESCANNDISYEPRGLFHSNLENLFQTLSIETPRNKGFYNNSSGSGSDRVNGRALCRGDVRGSICKTCLESASQEIMTKCQKKAAIIWYDKCQVQYSYGPLQDGYAGSYPDLKSQRASDPVGFCNAFNNLTAALSSAASSSENKFAYEKISYSKNETIYGLAQCTRDISPEACTQCLNSASDDLNGCQTPKGGAVLSPTCTVRVDLQQFYSVPGRTYIITVVVVSAVILLAALAGLYAFIAWCKRRQTKPQIDIENCQALVEMASSTHTVTDEESCMLSSKDFPFMEFSVIKVATNNFSDSYKLGQGGFGSVYKGILPDGKEIAVKRLSRRSWQGVAEFMNEIKIIAKLQHRNLVKLLSCGMEGNEKLLIYEYMPNKSLDIFLFDDEKRLLLDWNKRINIITGIARGLVYLHEESRLKIVHRDLKPSNVLLDQEMSAKISDFGMARIFCDNQNLSNTKRVVGTYGYMSPEYAMEGLFSVKSDVFSFGVLLLEIISGRRNNGFHLPEHHGQTLLAYAWKLWNEGQELDLADPMLAESCPREYVRRCIHIGLLCVQEDPSERPTMSQAVVLLESRLTALPEPNKPEFPPVRLALPVNVGGPSSAEMEPSVNLVTLTGMVPR